MCVSCVCVCVSCLCVRVSSDNPTQISSASVAVRVLDVNDNPPSLTHYLEAYVCESAKAGQVRQAPHGRHDANIYT